jgi:hypothetical protein
LLFIGFAWGFLTVVSYFHGKQVSALLEQDGRQAIATIEHIGGSEVLYSFTYNGDTFAGRSPIPSLIRSQVAVGESLPILYLPSNPRVNRPEGWKQDATRMFEILILPILVIALGIWIVLDLLSTRRILRNGIAVAGIVRGSDRYNRSGEITVTYEFSTPNQGKREGRGWSQELVPQGTQICVLYLPQDPKVSASYPLHHWRLGNRENKGT